MESCTWLGTLAHFHFGLLFVLCFLWIDGIEDSMSAVLLRVFCTLFRHWNWNNTSINTHYMSHWFYLLVILHQENGSIEARSSGEHAHTSVPPVNTSASSSSRSPAPAVASAASSSSIRMRKKSAFNTPEDPTEAEFRVFDEASGCVVRQDKDGYVFTSSYAAAIGHGFWKDKCFPLDISCKTESFSVC